MDARERLIQATRELLWERGYADTSPRAILDRAGVGQGSMYHHFAGKAELAAEALTRNARELQAEAEEVLDGPGTARERLVAHLRRERPVMMGCRLGRMTGDAQVLADPALRAPVEESFAHIRARLTALLAQGQADGELASSFDPGQVAATLLAVVQGGYVLARAAGDSEPFGAAIAGALDLLVPSVGAMGEEPGTGKDKA